MSKGALLSVLGLYQVDQTIFNDMSLPSGLNRETVIDAIIQDCMELEILYPNPDALKTMIQIWSARELPTWTRIYNAELAEYNPIENYDRHQSDSRQETHSGDDVTVGNNATEAERRRSGSISGESTSTGTQSGTSNGNTLHQYAAFDAGTLADQTKDIQTQTVNNSSGDSVENEQTSEESGTDSISETSRQTLTHGERVGETFTSYIHGNIGVTTSQQMLESELELAPKINTINYVVNSFKMRFCLLVY